MSVAPLSWHSISDAQRTLESELRNMSHVDAELWHRTEVVSARLGSRDRREASLIFYLDEITKRPAQQLAAAMTRLHVTTQRERVTLRSLLCLDPAPLVARCVHRSRKYRGTRQTSAEPHVRMGLVGCTERLLAVGIPRWTDMPAATATVMRQISGA